MLLRRVLENPAPAVGAADARALLCRSLVSRPETQPLRADLDIQIYPKAGLETRGGGPSPGNPKRIGRVTARAVTFPILFPVGL